MSSANNHTFVAYYRVSTARQGMSGLGLEAQQEAVRRYLEPKGARIVAEFTEVESGKRSDRPMLAKALHTCRLHGSRLIVAKLDRLSRNVAFLSNLLESGVDPVFVDLPNLDGPQGRFMLQSMAAVAELEAGMISTRTKAALAAAKARGVTLGGNRGTTLNASQRAQATAAKRIKAKARADDILPAIEDIRQNLLAQGDNPSASAIAKELSTRGIKTASGKANWQATQVQRVLARG